PLRVRVRPYVQLSRALLGAGNADAAVLVRPEAAGGTVFEVLAPIGRRLARGLGRIVDLGDRSDVDLRLRHAGFADTSADQYRMRQLGCTVTGSALGAVLGITVGGSSAMVLVLAALSTYAGASRWRARVDRAIRERREAMQTCCCTTSALAPSPTSGPSRWCLCVLSQRRRRRRATATSSCTTTATTSSAPSRRHQRATSSYALTLSPCAGRWRWRRSGTTCARVVASPSRVRAVATSSPSTSPSTAPGAAAPSMLGMVKVLVDGVVSALHTHDGTQFEVLADRLSQRLCVPGDQLAHLLTDSPVAVLDRRRLLWPFQSFVQWNPADDAIVDLRVTAVTSTTWQLSGALAAVRGTAHPSA
ncbi:MAG TPA: hypothetical protein VK988_01720, partial [Acidimicrobiales bacterium]|nr:hypothetical protein [Acidimicrobiales bacterium]